MNKEYLNSVASLASSDASRYANEIDPTLQAEHNANTIKQQKIEALAKAKAEKQANLGTDALGTNYAPTDYTGQQIKHKEVVNTTGVHDFLNQQEEYARLQREASVHPSLQDPNKEVTLSPNYDDPNLIGPHRRDEYAETAVPLNSFGQADTRNAYIKINDMGTLDTADDIAKFGLARNDLNAEAIRKGMTPASARYSNQEEFWPYEGPRYDRKDKDTAYDGTVGPLAMGEKIVSDQKFLYDPITKFELNRYMDRATINARAMGTGAESEKNYELWGGGAHEYTKMREDPFFADGIQAGKEVAPGTVTPTYDPRTYNEKGELLRDAKKGVSTEQYQDTLLKTLKQKETVDEKNPYAQVTDKGIGAYNLNYQDLIAAGLIDNRLKNNNLLSNPKAWQNDKGVNNIEEFLSNPAMQDAVALNKISKSMEKYKDTTDISELAGKVLSDGKVGEEATLYATLGKDAVMKQFATTPVSIGPKKQTPEEFMASYEHANKNRFINSLQGLGSAFTQNLIVDTADFIGEASKKYLGHGWDVGTEEEKTKMVNSWFGYDKKFSEDAQAEAKVVASDLFDMATNPNRETNMFDFLGKVKDIIVIGASTPEMLADSLGYVAALAVGLPKSLVFGGAKALMATEKALNASVKAGKMTKATAVKELAEVSADVGVVGKLGHVLASNAGLLTVSAGNVNDQIDDFKKNNNNVGPDGLDVMRMYGVDVIMNGLDRWTDIKMLKSPELLGGFKEAVKSMGRRELTTLAGAVTKTAGIIAVDMGVEAAQEYVQTMGEIVNKQYGTVKGESVIDVLTNKENVIEGITAAGMGAGGAVQFKAIGAAQQILADGRTAYLEPEDFTFNPSQTKFNTDSKLQAMYFAEPDKLKTIVEPEAQKAAIRAIMDVTLNHIADPDGYKNTEQLKTNRNIGEMVLDNVDKISTIKGVVSPELKAYIAADMGLTLQKKLIRLATESKKNAVTPEGVKAQYDIMNEISKMLEPLKVATGITGGFSSDVIKQFKSQVAKEEIKEVLHTYTAGTEESINKSGTRNFKPDKRTDAEMAEVTKRMEELKIKYADNAEIQSIIAATLLNIKTKPTTAQEVTIAGVDEQIFRNGFNIGNKHQKSMLSHTDDILSSYVKTDGKEELQTNLSKLGNFVLSRSMERKLKDVEVFDEETQKMVSKYDEMSKDKLARVIYNNNNRMKTMISSIQKSVGENPGVKYYAETSKQLNVMQDNIDKIQKEYEKEFYFTTDKTEAPTANQAPTQPTTKTPTENAKDGFFNRDAEDTPESKGYDESTNKIISTLTGLATDDSEQGIQNFNDYAIDNEIGYISRGDVLATPLAKADKARMADVLQKVIAGEDVKDIMTDPKESTLKETIKNRYMTALNEYENDGETVNEIDNTSSYTPGFAKAVQKLGITVDDFKQILAHTYNVKSYKEKFLEEAVKSNGTVTFASFTPSGISNKNVLARAKKEIQNTIETLEPLHKKAVTPEEIQNFNVAAQKQIKGLNYNTFDSINKRPTDSVVKSNLEKWLDDENPNVNEESYPVFKKELTDATVKYKKAVEMSNEDIDTTTKKFTLENFKDVTIDPIKFKEKMRDRILTEFKASSITSTLTNAVNTDNSNIVPSKFITPEKSAEFSSSIKSSMKESFNTILKTNPEGSINKEVEDAITSIYTENKVTVPTEITTPQLAKTYIRNMAEETIRQSLKSTDSTIDTVPKPKYIDEATFTELKQELDNHATPNLSKWVNNEVIDDTTFESELSNITNKYETFVNNSSNDESHEDGVPLKELAAQFLSANKYTAINADKFEEKMKDKIAGKVKGSILSFYLSSNINIEPESSRFIKQEERDAIASNIEELDKDLVRTVNNTSMKAEVKTKIANLYEDFEADKPTQNVLDNMIETTINTMALDDMLKEFENSDIQADNIKQPSYINNTSFKKLKDEFVEAWDKIQEQIKTGKTNDIEKDPIFSIYQDENLIEKLKDLMDRKTTPAKLKEPVVTLTDIDKKYLKEFSELWRHDFVVEGTIDEKDYTDTANVIKLIWEVKRDDFIIPSYFVDRYLQANKDNSVVKLGIDKYGSIDNLSKAVTKMLVNNESGPLKAFWDNLSKKIYDYVTKITAKFGPTKKANLEKFLAQATRENIDLEKFLTVQQEKTAEIANKRKKANKKKAPKAKPEPKPKKEKAPKEKKAGSFNAAEYATSLNVADLNGINEVLTENLDIILKNNTNAESIINMINTALNEYKGCE